jgi:hypothetical protein
VVIDSSLEVFARWDSTWLFANVARQHFDLFQAKQQEAEKIRLTISQSGDDRIALEHIADVCEDGAFECGLAVILFAAIAIEAHINEYGSRRLGESCFKRHIDKLGTVSKWVLVPRLITGREVPRDCHAFQLLVDLFRWRNQLVHPKAKDIIFKDFVGDVEKRLDDRSKLFAFAPQAIKALEELAKAAQMLHPDDPMFGRVLILQRYGDRFRCP